MKKIGDRLADRFAQHDVNLARLEAHHSRKILKMLKKLENDLLGKIAKTADGNAPFTAARSQALLKLTRTLINQHYELIAKENRGQLADLARYEFDATATIMNKTIGVKLLSVGVPDSVINSMLKEDTAVGVPLKSFWQQSTNLRNRFIEQVRAGTFAGETMGQMVQRIRGTKAKGFKDGVMQASRSGAEAVVRTASQSILNDARMGVYEANSDVIGGVQVQSTLDGRTSEICIARSRSAWDLEGNPLGDTEESFPGPPPWHVNCRSTLIPIVKSMDEILGTKGVDKKLAKGISKSTQASMDGQVAGTLDYSAWLKTKSEGFQQEVLGLGKWKLWKEDKITLRDLIDQRGRPVSLKELRKES